MNIWQYWKFTAHKVDSYCFGLFKTGFLQESRDMQHGDLADSKGGRGFRETIMYGSLIVLILGTVLQDACELHIVEVVLLVNGSLPEELIHLLICKPVTHCCEQIPEVILLDEAYSRIRLEGEK